MIKRWAFAPFLVIVCLFASDALLRSHMSGSAATIIGLVAALPIGWMWDQRRQRTWPRG